MVKKKRQPSGGIAVAKAVAAAMRKRDRRAWTIVEYGGADWTHGYCTGDRPGAWRASAGKLVRVKPPAILEVPYAQFCAKGMQVLVESATVQGSGKGEVFEMKSGKSGVMLDARADGVRWRVGN